MAMQIRVKVGVCLNKSHEAIYAYVSIQIATQHVSSTLHESFYCKPSVHTQNEKHCDKMHVQSSFCILKHNRVGVTESKHVRIYVHKLLPCMYVYIL